MSAPKRSSQHRGPGGRGMMAGDKAKDFRGTIVKLRSHPRSSPSSDLRSLDLLLQHWQKVSSQSIPTADP